MQLVCVIKFVVQTFIVYGMTEMPTSILSFVAVFMVGRVIYKCETIFA